METSNLTEKEAALYAAMVSEAEQDSVYLDNVSWPNRKEMTGLLSSLTKKGYYRQRGTDGQFGTLLKLS